MLKLMGNKIFTVFAQKFVYLYQYYFSYSSTKTYDVGTQKNCLNEMILLRAKTNDKIDGLKIIYNFSLNNFIYLNLRISKILLNPCLLVHLLMTFANSLDPEQARQNVGPDLGPNSLTL